MSRIAAKFEALKRSGRKALIPFITAGDPDLSFTVPAMHALVKAGADIIELGVPFSDPMADGPAIQKASERALAHHTSLRNVLKMVEEFRSVDRETPVVLMGYLNPVECMGYLEFSLEAQRIGVDGVLTVDLPPEESAEFLPMLDKAGIDPIFLLAPNSTKERIQHMSRLARGYIYYVSLKGVTGAAHLDLADVGEKISQIRELTNLPIAVGFGVKNAEIAAQVAGLGDGVVVGSALVSKVEQAGSQALNEMSALISAMRQAMDA